MFGRPNPLPLTLCDAIAASGRRVATGNVPLFVGVYVLLLFPWRISPLCRAKDEGVIRSVAVVKPASDEGLLMSATVEIWTRSSDACNDLANGDW